jgi:hypothetical protein
MPFGKFKWKPLADIPDSYLHWLLDEADGLERYYGLRAAIEGELRQRGYGDDVDDDAPAGMIAMRDVHQVVNSWFREQSLRWHPDRGGSDQAMQAINHAHDRLRQLLGVA